LNAEIDYLRALFSNLEEGVCFFERLPLRPDGLRDFRYLATNPAFQRMFGVADLTGTTIRDDFPDETENWYDDFDSVLETGQPVSLSQRSDPQGMVLELHVSKVAEADGVLLAVTRNITTRHEDEEQREQAWTATLASENRQAFALRLSDALRAESDPDVVAERALAMLLQHLEVDLCYLASYRLPDDRADITHQLGKGAVPKMPPTIRLSDFPEAFRQVFDRTLVIDDVAQTPGLSDTDRQNMASLGFGAIMSATLRSGDNNPLWVLASVTARARHWTKEEIALLEETAERTWAAIERARNEATIREREARLSLVQQAARIGSFDFDLASGVVRASPEYLELYGYRADEGSRFTFEAWLSLVHPQDRERIESELGVVLPIRPAQTLSIRSASCAPTRGNSAG
jgi:GAF domain-containing protein